VTAIATRSPATFLRRPGSTALAIGYILVALAAATGLKVFAERQTVGISQGGVIASVPAGWQVAAGVPGTALLATDPRRSETQLAAAILTTQPNELALIAHDLTTERNNDLLGFEVTKNASIRLAGRNGEQLEYVYVTRRSVGELQLMRGVDFYSSVGTSAFRATLVAPDVAYQDYLPIFWRFAASIRTPASP